MKSFELSENQKGLWFLQQYDKSSFTYNMTACLEIRGKLDIQRLNIAFQRLVGAHDILRSSYHLQNDQPIARINDQSDFHLVIESITQKHTLNSLIKRDAQIAFDLEQNVFRAKLYVLDNGHHILLISYHHIAGDMLSFKLLWERLNQFYQNPSINIDETNISNNFFSYIQQQKDSSQNEQQQLSKQYWLNNLKYCDTNNPFQRYITSRHNKDIHIEHYQFDICQKRYQSIKKWCQQNKTTPYRFMLACLYIVINRYNQKDDIIISTTSTGRLDFELQFTVGYFVNILPLRFKLEGTETFSQLIEDINQMMNDSLVHQNYPFRNIVKNLKTCKSL